MCSLNPAHHHLHILWIHVFLKCMKRRARNMNRSIPGKLETMNCPLRGHSVLLLHTCWMQTFPQVVKTHKLQEEHWGRDLSGNTGKKWEISVQDLFTEKRMKTCLRPLLETWASSRKEGLPWTGWTKKRRSSNQHSDLLTSFNLQACSLSTTFLGSNICSCAVTPKLMRANKIPTAWLSRYLRSYLLALGVLTEHWWVAWLLNVCVMFVSEMALSDQLFLARG